MITARAQALAQRYPATGKQVFVADQSVQAATVERAIRPQAVALALFALALALTTLLIVGQVAVRTLLAAAADNAALAVLGMTRRQLLAAGLLEVAAATAAGGAAAVVIAIAASPLMPVGPARLAEPDPGVSVNGPVLAAGFAAIAALLLARVAVTAWRQASARAARRRTAAEPWPAPPAARRPPGRAGAPLGAVTGLRLALDPGRAGRASRFAARCSAWRWRSARSPCGHVRREPAAPGRHPATVRARLGHRVRGASSLPLRRSSSASSAGTCPESPT